MIPEDRTPRAPTQPKRKKYRIVGVSQPSAMEPSTAAPPSPETSEHAGVRLFSKTRHELIAEAAYHLAERRGFRGGDPEQDWCEAEAEVEKMLRSGRPF